MDKNPRLVDMHKFYEQIKNNSTVFGADNRSRTCTVTHQILSLARLPIPPYPRIPGALPGGKTPALSTPENFGGQTVDKIVVHGHFLENTGNLS